MKRFLKIAGIVIGVLILIVIAIPFFIDANTFNPKLESELTDASGRPGESRKSLPLAFLGSVAADNISIADDPQFSKTACPGKIAKGRSRIIPLIYPRL